MHLGLRDIVGREHHQEVEGEENDVLVGDFFLLLVPVTVRSIADDEHHVANLEDEDQSELGSGHVAYVKDDRCNGQSSVEL